MDKDLLIHSRKTKAWSSTAMLIGIGVFNACWNNALANIPGLAPKSPWDLDGYISYVGVAQRYDTIGTVDDHQLQNRLNFEYRFDSPWRFNASMRNRVLVGDSLDSEVYRSAVTEDMGYFNLSYDWHNSDNAIVTSQFDRLYVTYQDNNIKGRIGRYRVNWGMNTLWNPNDLFNPYSIYNVDYPEKPGVDAAEFTYKLGFASEVNAVYAPNQNRDLDSYAARYLFNRDGWDAQIIAGKSYLDLTLGAGVAGDIKGIGLKAELSYFSPYDEQAAVSLGIELDSALVASAEATYSFGGLRNWMGNAAILYLSDAYPLDTTSTSQLPLTARTLSFTQWTGYADIGFDLTALSRVTAQGSYYDDGSYFLGASLSYSLADNWTLSGFVQYFDGVINNTSVYGQLGWYF
ncbi:hypothetical protein [Vibrio sp. qd031]|uniref:hypothetical protein n=1 Tax=Vibrio sp. qd031 TaxID=1603038 RepID=UPI001F5B7AB7|nr:hypothetical protein [Vibrio sp. qd031]